MVANYRCNEIKDEAEKLVQKRIQALMQQSTVKEITDFRD